MDTSALSDLVKNNMQEFDFPKEDSVDEVISNPKYYDLHMVAGATPSIKSAHWEGFKKLPKRSGDSKFPDDPDTDVHWSPIMFDYRVGLSDVVAIDGCMLDVGVREGADRYLSEYVSVGIPAGVMRVLRKTINSGARFKLNWKKSVIKDGYRWISVSIREGMEFKFLTNGNETEKSLTRASVNKIRADEGNVVSAIIFICVGATMRVKRGTELADLASDTAGSISPKLIGCHMSAGASVVEPPAHTAEKLL